MRSTRLHARWLILLALFALGGQAAVVFEAAWHSHEHSQRSDGGQDGCAICAAVSQTGTPVPDLVAVEQPAAITLIRIAGEARPAFLCAAPAIGPRGPPSTAAL